MMIKYDFDPMQESRRGRANSIAFVICFLRCYHSADSNGVHGLVVVVPENETGVPEAVPG